MSASGQRLSGISFLLSSLSVDMSKFCHASLPVRTMNELWLKMRACIHFISQTGLVWIQQKNNNNSTQPTVTAHSSDSLRNPRLCDFSEPTLPAKFALTD